MVAHRVTGPFLYCKAEELIASFKQDVKACDKPAKAKDAGKFLSYYAGTSRQIKDSMSSM